MMKPKRHTPVRATLWVGPCCGFDGWGVEFAGFGGGWMPACGVSLAWCWGFTVDFLSFA